VRQLFYGETDDELIEECLRIANIENWAKDLKPIKKKQRVYPDWTIHGLIWNALCSRVKQTRFYLSCLSVLAKVLFLKELIGLCFSESKSMKSRRSKGKSRRSDVKITKKSESLNVSNVSDVLDICNPFDVQIKQRHSGGEKSRLMIAILVYRLIRLIQEDEGKHRMFVLDEPEQGIDPPMAYEILNAIKKRFPSTTIFVISHLEKIHKIGWDNVLFVEKGEISLN
jgi:ABC-type ATPase involved in cell division